MVMCFAPSCSHYSDRHECSFFQFPKQELEFLRWKILVGRQDKEPKLSSRVCSCHFLNGLKSNYPTQFNYDLNNMKGRKKLPSDKSMTSFRECSVMGCPNNNLNSPQLMFYRFIFKRKDLDRRAKWIAAVGRIGFKGKPWKPTMQSRICSEHFVGGLMSDDPSDIAYIPTLLPHNTITDHHEDIPHDEGYCEQFLREPSTRTDEKLIKMEIKNIDGIIIEKLHDFKEEKNRCYQIIDEVEESSEQMESIECKTQYSHKPKPECFSIKKVSSKKYRCRHCSYNSDYEGSVWIHFQKRHLKLLEQIVIEHSYCTKKPTEDDISSPEIKYKCYDCDFESTDKHSIETHVSLNIQRCLMAQDTRKI